MRTAEELDTEIKQLNTDMDAAVGSECEVYTRIVGYYRSIRNWNPGKAAEFNDRKYFKVKRDHGHI